MNSWIIKFKNKIEAIERMFKQKRADFRIIHKGDLKLYLDENNKIRLYYKDNEFTKGPGLSTDIFTEGSWYSSSDFVVDNIKRPSPEEMVFCMKHSQIPLMQIWHLKFNSEDMLSWKVNIHIKEPLRIDCGKSFLFLSKAYQDWIAFPEYGCFPICFNSEWQRMTPFESKPDFIGVFSPLEGFPGLAFRNKDSKGLLMIQNTDLNLSSRVLEMQFEEEKEHYLPRIYPYLDVVIQIYPDKSILENIVKEIKLDEQKKQEEEQKKRELLKLQEEERLKKAKEEEHKLRILQSGSFKFYIDQQNKAHIYYKEQELTKGVGVNISMLSEGSWYASCDSRIEIKRPSSHEMLIEFIHNKLPLTYFWNLEFKPEGIIIWNVNIRLKEPLRIDKINAHLFLSKSYNSWIVPHKGGSFPPSFNQGWQRIDTSENNAEFIGLYSSMEELPDIICKNPGSPNSLLVLQNTDSNLSSRVLGIQIEDNKEFYQPGTYLYFKATIEFYPDKNILKNMLKEIKLDEQKKQEEEQKKRELLKLQEEERLKKAKEEEHKLRILQSGSFKFYIDQQNKAHIYYKEQELTKGVGVNISMLSEGSWYASCDSRIEIKRPSSHEMLIEFIHNKLPLTYFWNLEFKPEGIIIWNVNIRLKEPLRIDKINAHLFLSKSYNSWIVPHKGGSFPPSFNQGWQRIDTSENNAEFIGLYSSMEELPDIICKNPGSPNSLLVLQNTDSNLSSRVLGIQIEDNKEFYQPGTYLYFKATIELYPDKNILKNMLKEIKLDEQKKQEEEQKRIQESERLRRLDEQKKQEEEQKKRELLKLQEEERLKKAKEEEYKLRILQSGSFKFYIDQQNKAHIYYKEQELTKGVGVNISMLSEGSWYASCDSRIEIKRPSCEEIVIYFSHNKLPLTYIWHVKLKTTGVLVWNANIHLKEPLRIDKINAHLFLSKSYNSWIVPHKGGSFPPSFNQGWQRIDTSENNAEFIGLYSSMEELPDIICKNPGSPNSLLVLQNTDSNLSSRVLGIQIEDNKEFYQPGTYLYFKATIELYPDKNILKNMLKEIKLDEQKKQEEEQKRIQESERLRRLDEQKKQEEEQKRIQESERLRRLDEQKKQEEEQKKRELLKLQEEERLKKAKEEEHKLRILQSGSFKFYIDQQNKAHIYYKEQELTKGVGVNISMLSEGSWYASRDSRIEIKRPSSHEMLIEFIHNKLPLTYFWNLEFKPEGIIIWNVNIRLKEPLRIDKINAHLFLSKSYNSWIVPHKGGSFPPSFNQGWQRIDTSENNAEFIGLYSSMEELPDIICKNPGSPNSLLVLQNTDSNLSSRVLEIQIEDNKEFYQPGTYLYFKATIELYPDKNILKNMLKEIKLDEQKKQEEEQKEDEFKKIDISLKEDEKGVSLIKGNDICVYGDDEKLHDKISSQPGGFNKVILKIKRSIRKNTSVNIKIGISRFNFLKLNSIIQYYSELLNSRIDLRSVSLNFLPAKNLFYYFKEYIKELNTRLESSNIRLFLKDKELLNILWAISSQADQYNEKILLRLLGVIIEHPLIGPQTIVLDTYHKCNTNCIHCWVHTPKRKLPLNLTDLKMDYNLYTSIIDDAAKLLCDEIIFQGDGEPILDARFFKMVRYARDKGLKVIFFTNAISLTRQKIKKIIDLEVNEIFCSLPAGMDRTYALINPGHSKGTFHHIVANLKDLALAREESGKDKPLLQMTHVIHNLNYHELEEMAKIDACVRADKTRFYLVRLDENIKFLKLKASHIKAIKESLKKIKPYLNSKNIELQDNIYFQIKNYKPKTGCWSENTFLKSGCPVGWFFCLILAKGELSMCCHLRIVDYLKRNSFAQIWGSEQYNKVRTQAKYLANNKNVSVAGDIKLYDDFCKHCDTHQVIFMINQLMDRYNLRKFL